MAYDKETDRYMSDEELRKLNRERKRALNRAKYNELQAKNRLERANTRVRVREKVGTPVGNKQRMQAFKNAFLRDSNLTRVFDKIMAAALNDKHPNQATAWKLCAERGLPVSLFEENKGSAAVHITICRDGGVKLIESGVTIESEDEDEADTAP